MAEIKKYLDTTALGALVDQIKAEDTKVKAYADAQIEAAGKTYDTAGAAATAESNAKKYTDELANGQVATNKSAIATLNGDASTEGSVAKAVADAKSVLEGSIGDVDAKADKNAEDIAAINNAENGILAQAKAHAEAEDAKVQGNVDTLSETVADLSAFVGAIPEGYTQETVIAYVNKKAEETLAAAQGGSSETAASVKAQLETYKAENDAAVEAIEGDVAELETAIATEKSRAEGVEAGLETRLKAVEDDHLTSADKTELQGNINTVAGAVERLTNGVSAEEIDGVNDLIQYVKDHGTEVTGMQEDISDNAEAIAGVAERMGTAEGKITALETASALHAEKTYVDEQIQTLQGVDTGLDNRLKLVEAAVCESGSVADDIATAKQEAIDAAAVDATQKANAAETAAKGYTDAEIDKVEGTIATLTETVGTKAAQSDLTALTGKVTTAEGEIDTLQSEMDAVEAKAAANETAISGLQTAVNGKVAQGDFDNAVARIAQNETDIAALEEAAETHALASDLTAAVARISANETAIAANTSAINSFTAITADEVNALFA